MSQTITLAPLTRVEGHLEIEVTVDTVNGKLQVVDAKAAGAMFRGFETILKGRDARDATHLTQRICGVCPISHGMASSLGLEAAIRVTPAENGRIIRNLVLGANFVQSHILHFYHLAAPDFIDTTGALDMAPWTPRFVTPDMARGALGLTLIQHYVQALAMRRKAHQMGAILGGKLPCSPVFVPGGATTSVTAQRIADFRALLTELRTFIDTVYVPDVLTVAGAYPEYYQIGRGCGNLLAYGVFDLNSAGTSKLLARGHYTDGVLGSLDTGQIKEYVKYSWYTPASGNLKPASGVTDPDAAKSGAYSWIKAPRYNDRVHEVGPLARMWVNGDYRSGVSVLDRTAARALECKKVADAMNGWLNQLVVGGPVYVYGALDVAPQAAPLAADANGDGRVDGADLAAWQSNYDPLGRNPNNSRATGDFNGDGLVNGADLSVWQSSYMASAPAGTALTGIGLTEAPRGAVGHWIEIANKKITRYQVVTPTQWNASPMDDRGQKGAIEQALIGTPVGDATQPIEVLRVVHSFDPCLSCAVHVMRPGKKADVVVVA